MIQRPRSSISIGNKPLVVRNDARWLDGRNPSRRETRQILDDETSRTYWRRCTEDEYAVPPLRVILGKARLPLALTFLSPSITIVSPKTETTRLPGGNGASLHSKGNPKNIMYDTQRPSFFLGATRRPTY